MTKVRKAAVAGLFYPKKEKELSQMVERFISEAQADDIIPKALIAPHAGYVYSGPIAGTAYAYLKKTASAYTKAVVIGPAHRLAFSGVAAPSHDYFETPLGRVLIDRETITKLESLGFVQILDAAHAEEHSLEVQIPFLQKTLPEMSLVPLLVGRIESDRLSSLIGLLAEDQTNIIIISSDLSHFEEYSHAQALDQETSRSIESLEDKRISGEAACGVYPIRGLLQYAREAGLRVKTVDLANSGDTAGSKDSVVGYGAYVFY